MGGAAWIDKRVTAIRGPSPSGFRQSERGWAPQRRQGSDVISGRAIRLRRGQPAFRAALFEAYGRRCVITECAVEDVPEAAHITPYLGSLTNHVSNGLLLWTDLHTLFDCGLLAIEPTTRTIVIANSLKASTYAKIAGKKLRPPKDAASGPSRPNWRSDTAYSRPCLKTFQNKEQRRRPPYQVS